MPKAEQKQASSLPPSTTTLSQSLVLRLVDAVGAPIPGATITWIADHFGGSVTTDATGTASVLASFEGAISAMYAITLRWGSAAQTVARAYVVGPGGNTACAPVSGRDQSGPVGTRLPSPIVVSCAGRGGAGTYNSVRVTDPTQTQPGGLLLPVPGYRQPGEFWFYWVLPQTPGSWWFVVISSAGLNHTTATATP